MKKASIYFLMMTLLALILPCEKSAGQAKRFTVPRIVATASQTVNSSTGFIPLTTVFTPQKSGVYRITAYMVETIAPIGCNPGDSCGGLVLDFSWTDDAGPQYAFVVDELYITGCPCSSVSGQAVARVNAGAPLQYQIYGGSDQGATYEYYFTVEQLM